MLEGGQAVSIPIAVLGADLIAPITERKQADHRFLIFSRVMKKPNLL